MLLDDQAVEELSDRFDIDLRPELVAEFNHRVAMADHEVDVSPVTDEVERILARLYRMPRASTYDELRTLEREVKAFHVYAGLIAASVARSFDDDGLPEVRMWQLEAARRISSEHTADLTFWHDGEESSMPVWNASTELAIPTDDMHPVDSPLAPIERRINALIEDAAVRALDQSDRAGVGSCVRVFDTALPRAAGMLAARDVRQTEELTLRFRAAAEHPQFSRWFIEQSDRNGLPVLSLEEYLTGTWSARMTLYRREDYLAGAERLISKWENSRHADNLTPSDGEGLLSASIHDEPRAMGDLNTVHAEAGGLQVLARLSWTAYVGLATGWLVGAAIVGVVGLLVGGLVTALAAAAWIALGAYRVLSLRSVVLFLDQDGIWVEHGVLPWNTGAYGVKWRDLDEAVFFPGFLDWLTRSYTIVLRHRFTKDAEVALAHVAQGDQVVMAINARHGQALGER